MRMDFDKCPHTALESNGCVMCGWPMWDVAQALRNKWVAARHENIALKCQLETAMRRIDDTLGQVECLNAQIDARDKETLWSRMIQKLTLQKN